MSKTVSSRIPKDLHDRLRKKCNEDGCNTNDFIRNMLEAELTEENCQDQENNSRPGRNTTPKEITVRDIPDEEPNPKDSSTWKNNKKSTKQIEVIWI